VNISQVGRQGGHVVLMVARLFKGPGGRGGGQARSGGGGAMVFCLPVR
jgi:hypothetical protein